MQQRVLVCGGRGYDDRDRLFLILDRAHWANPIELLVHGAATGADTLAGLWAKERGVSVQAFPADWKKYGDAAGPIRNGLMLEATKPHMVIAFPGGRGTANMVKLARHAGIPIVRVRRANAGPPS
jgi:hypothetical protein